MEETNITHLRVLGPLHRLDGYSRMTRALVRCAQLAGFETQAVESDLRMWQAHFTDDDRIARRYYLPKPGNLMDWQHREVENALKVRCPDGTPTILAQLPHNLRHYPHYSTDAPVFGYTMTESDNLCRDWLHGTRNVDAVISPSSYCTETFRRVAPDTPTFTVPIPVDERIWIESDYVEAIPHNAPPFLFLSVFKTSERKNWRMLIQAFAEEFCKEGKKVGLILKPSRATEVAELADCGQEMGAWIKVDGDKRNDYMLAALYRACTVYVQPSSEGFGLPALEAAFCGLPTVALDKSGSTDVVTEATGYLVPSHMAPVVGHMIQWYPRQSHNFATCEIDDLRATLRRAYEEEKAKACKGAAAKVNALDKFTPQAIAPKLREAVEQGVEISRANRAATAHPAKPEWATVAGAWGDVFCSCGNIRALMRDKEMERIGVVYYGRDPGIATWLEAQPWIREVLSFVERDQFEMTKFYGRLCQAKPLHARIAWAELFASRNLDIQNIAYTQLCLAECRPPKYWRGAILPSDAHAWAERVKPDGPFFILNPLSIASNTMADHWRYWGMAIQWVIDNTLIPVVMVGEKPIMNGKEPWPSHPNLIDLSGESRSMMDVLALAERSAGIISTSNNLGIYTPLIGVEGVIVMARTCHKSAFYHGWYEAPRAETGWAWTGHEDDPRAYSTHHLIEWEDPFCDFQRVCEERFPDYFRDQSERDIVSEQDYYNVEAMMGRME